MPACLSVVPTTAFVAAFRFCFRFPPEGFLPFGTGPAWLPDDRRLRIRRCLTEAVCLGVWLAVHVPRDFVLDPELFAFKFNDAEIVGVRPVFFGVNCVFDGRMLGAQ